MIAIMVSTGLAFIYDVTKKDAVVERMLHYQAEELALNVEMMRSWESGTIEMQLGKDTTIKTFSSPGSLPADVASGQSASSAYGGNLDTPQNQFITVERHNETGSTVVASYGMLDDHQTLRGANFCLRKNINGFSLNEGRC